MTPRASMLALAKPQRELLAFLFESKSNAVRAPLTTWVATSPRYATFVEMYKDKIRKKLRLVRGDDAVADLLCELQVPYWFLQDKHFEVAYEPYAAGKTRGPDYAVTFRTNFTFNIEITHMRGQRRPRPASPGHETAIDLRLVDVLCSKLGQFPAGMANLLVVGTDSGVIDRLDLHAHIAWIKGSAERRDPLFYARTRFLSPADFFKHYGRLSGLTVYDSRGLQKHLVWFNPQARVRLPDPVKTILERGVALLRGSSN